MLKIENVEVVGWNPAIRGMRNPKNSWEKSDSGWDESIWEYDEDGVGTLKSIPVIEDYDQEYYLGPNDQKLMMTLRNAGTDHRKFMRFLVVYLDITAPLYWWKEFKTYRAGRKFGDPEPDIMDPELLEMDIETNSCSTMHKIHAKEFELDDFSHEHLLWSDRDDPALHSGDILLDVIAMLNYCRKDYLKTKDKKYWNQMIQLLPSSYNQKRTVMLNYEVLANIYKSRRHHKLDEWHVVCDWIESLPYAELITGVKKEEEK